MVQKRFIFMKGHTLRYEIFKERRYARASIFVACFLTALLFSYSMLKNLRHRRPFPQPGTGPSSNVDEVASKAAETATVTDTSYSDDNISVTLTSKSTRVNNTQVYAVDAIVSQPSCLKTAPLANTY